MKSPINSGANPVRSKSPLTTAAVQLRASNGISGLTIFELLIVIGILTVLFGLSAPVAANFYRDYQLDSDKNLLVSLLRQASNNAIINRNQAPHGIYWDANNFIVFQGQTYVGRNATYDRIFPRTTSVTIAGPTEIVFTQLSGRTASSTYSLSNDINIFNIYINSEGSISD